MFLYKSQISGERLQDHWSSGFIVFVWRSSLFLLVPYITPDLRTHKRFNEDQIIIYSKPLLPSFLHKIIYCGYILELPRRGDSKGTHNI